MAMLKRVIAANARPSRADLESPAYDLRAALKWKSKEPLGRISNERVPTDE